VVRRIIYPDAFYTIDGLLETLMTVLDEMTMFPAVIERELDRYFPFLATTRLLMAAVKSGTGRELAHERIKLHAVEAARSLREGGEGKNPLFDLVAADPELNIPPESLETIASDRTAFVGTASRQVDAVADRVARIVEHHPSAAGYRPSEIL
jgi:adenylosuccinate lyase